MIKAISLERKINKAIEKACDRQLPREARLEYWVKAIKLINQRDPKHKREIEQARMARIRNGR